MQELTDDQLDGLFRKSAEEFDPPFDPAAWQAMRNQLDTHDRTTSGPVQLRERLIRWGLPLVLLLMLLLIGGSWYTSHKEFSRRTTPSQSGLATTGNHPHPLNRRVWAPLAFDPLTSSEPEPATERPLARVKENKKIIPLAAATSARIKTKALSNGPSSTNKPLLEPATIQPVDEAVPDRPSAVSSKPEPLPGRPATERSTSGRYRSQTRQTRRRLTSPDKPLTSRTDHRSLALIGLTGSANGFKPARQPFRIANPDWTAPVADVSSAASRPVETVDQPRMTTSSPSSVKWLAIRPGQWPDKLAFTTRPVTAQPDTAARQQPTSLSVPRGLSVRFMVSPDLSAVGLRNFARPGTNIGLALEYRLASRWSLQAGAVWSRKVYNARPTDYELPAHWYSKVKPTGVSGECSMIDIPVNLRYDVISRTRSNGRPPSRWFVSGGVTSYILLNEDYTYNYATPSDPAIRYWSHTVDSTTRYGLSHLNLSVGYERALSRRLSWQIEPFMKVPLKSVGYFKINLLSTGAFLSLRYKL
ncbi:hypothetical protein GGR92_003165 [Spirosoma lacussanchae]|uniref:hypothetical protein n=1 Tax=Spirosoma lacussanchae TaxID=1884249 RepID=UPI0011095F25|nr:hypothetical protein [Spirosoma lacussanchae]